MSVVRDSEDHNLHLLVAGNHNDNQYGKTCEEIKDAGFTVSAQIPSNSSVAKSAAAVLEGIYAYLSSHKVDFLVILGDRFEMLSAAQAAILAQTPIIHIGGGYTTTGAIDNSIRDAISKLSKYHLVATEKCKEKVISLGEKEDFINITGAPDLEILTQVDYLSRKEFCQEVGLDEIMPFLLVTIHPETMLDPEEHKKCINQFGEFLLELDCPVIMTSPCADPGAQDIFMMIEFLKNNEDFIYRTSLGGRLYVNALRHASIVVGNSSSGIIEAGSFEVPVINVGSRQKGREQNKNVLNSSFNLATLLKVCQKANTDEFRESLRGIQNIYGDGKFVGKFESLFLNK